jgi:hypothetical protein
MGTLAEKVFTVRQEHNRDVMPICQFKVGGMGVSLFSGDTKIESYLYTEIARWLARSQRLCRHCFARLMHPLHGQENKQGGSQLSLPPRREDAVEEGFELGGAWLPRQRLR